MVSTSRVSDAYQRPNGYEWMDGWTTEIWVPTIVPLSHCNCHIVDALTVLPLAGLRAIYLRVSFSYSWFTLPFHPSLGTIIFLPNEVHTVSAQSSIPWLNLDLVICLLSFLYSFYTLKYPLTFQHSDLSSLSNWINTRNIISRSLCNKSNKHIHEECKHKGGHCTTIFFKKKKLPIQEW